MCFFFIQVLLLMSVFEQRLSFWMLYFMKNGHKIIMKCRWGSQDDDVSSAVCWWWTSDSGSGEKAPEKFRGQLKDKYSWKQKKPSKLIYFEWKLDVSMFLYALKWIFIKIKFENSEDWVFLPPTGHQNCLDNSQLVVAVERCVE